MNIPPPIFTSIAVMRVIVPLRNRNLFNISVPANHKVGPIFLLFTQP